MSKLYNLENMNYRNPIMMVILLAASHGAVGQNAASDSTGLPGDNFSLEGALELFKKAESPESFEKMLNSEENKVNNLDLNGDGEIDYVKVIDKQENDVHAFVLQATISENESQDIAVIEVEKTGESDATVQIVGDEDIYGEQTVVEPKEQVKTNAGTQTQNVNVNVYAWPSVRYVYGPSYRVWVSPWGWRARPVWWHPWRPVRYHVFHPYHHPYRHRYAITHNHRTIHAHRIYAPGRTTSVIVRTRHHEPVNHYRVSRTTRTTDVNGAHGRSTRKTTVVKGKSGSKKAVKRTSRSRN
jgi:hypothetical protein